MHALSISIAPVLQAGSWLGSLNPAILPLVVFALRTTDLTLATWRLLSMVQGHRGRVWILGFLQAMFFITAVAGVLAQLSNPWNLVGYAAGFATGSVAGLWVETRFGAGHTLLRVSSPARGPAIAEALHDHGYGATELPGRHIDGTISLILCYVPRPKVDQLRNLITAADPAAFISAEAVRRIGGGWRA